MSTSAAVNTPSWASRNRFTFLTLSLLALLLIYPFFTNSWAAELVLALTTFGVLIFGINAVSESRTQVMVGVALALIPIGRHVVAAVGAGPAWGAQDNLAAIPFFLYILVTMIRHIRAREVDRELVSAGISVYLLLGFTWTQVYTLIERFAPGSFSRGGESVSYSELTYFSFVTLTTLGYGDISPVSEYARSFAIVEAISGVVFMGVFIGGMVGTLVGKLSRDRG